MHPYAGLDQLLEGCQIIDREWRYLYVNEAVAKQGRSTTAELLGRTMMDAYPGIEKTQMFSILRECMTERTPQSMENEFTFPDGSRGWFELRFEPVPEGVFILSLEITDRKRAEVRLRKLNNVLRTLSGANQALVRAVDEIELLKEVCGVLVETGRYSTAWVGLTSNGEVPVRADAHAVSIGSRFNTEAPPGIESVREVLQSGVPVVYRDRTMDTSHGDSSPRFLGTMVLPLVLGEKSLGVLVVLSRDPVSFEPEEIDLLNEMADDLAYGIDALRGRRTAREALEALKESETRFSLVFDGVGEGILLIDPETRQVTRANTRMSQMLGYAPGELVGVNIRDIHPAEVLDRLTKAMLEAVHGERPLLTGIPSVRRDGVAVQMDVKITGGVIQGKACSVCFYSTDRRE